MEENNNVDKIDNQDNNKEQEKKKKSTIVPSYVKKEEEHDPNETITKKKPKSKISLIILLILLIVLITGVSFGIYKLVMHNKFKAYYDYETKMDTYGFSKMYNNGTANTTEYITKSEAIKVMTSSILNTNNVPETMEEEVYRNSNWVKYAASLGFVKESDDISIYDGKVSYMEVMQYFKTIKQVYVKKDLDIDLTPEFQDMFLYSNEEKIIVQDLVYNKIIQDSKKELKGYDNIVKGQLNELIINYVEKYNLITRNDEKLAINEDKMPSNKAEYPYVLANINKKIYETPFYKADANKFKTPMQIYDDIKEAYDTYEVRVSRYFETILNVDYRTIQKEDFIYNMEKCLGYNFDKSIVDEYLQYVEKNNIIMEGNAQIQSPIIYFDGENIRIRVKLEYIVNNSKTGYDLIFGDLINSTDNNYSYTLNETSSLYVDVPFIKEDDNTVGRMIYGAIKLWESGKVSK